MTATTPSKPAQGTVAAWKLVPVEPTDEMFAAVTADLRGPDYMPGSFDLSDAEWATRFYRAMLAAAPEPAASPPGEVEDRIFEAISDSSTADFYDISEDGLRNLAMLAARASLASDATANSKAGDEDVRGASLSRDDICRLWQWVVVNRPSMTIEGFTSMLLNEIDDRATPETESRDDG